MSVWSGLSSRGPRGASSSTTLPHLIRFTVRCWELFQGENWKNNTLLLLIIWVGMETLFQQVGMVTTFSMILKNLKTGPETLAHILEGCWSLRQHNTCLIWILIFNSIHSYYFSWKEIFPTYSSGSITLIWASSTTILRDNGLQSRLIYLHGSHRKFFSWANCLAK